jgi:hypothetical protein
VWTLHYAFACCYIKTYSKQLAYIFLTLPCLAKCAEYTINSWDSFIPEQWITFLVLQGSRKTAHHRNSSRCGKVEYGV